MRTFRLRAVMSLGVLLTVGWLNLVHTQGDCDNCPPEVSILWPQRDNAFSASTLIKIKAEATDPDGSIAQVQFFAETNLIGVATNSPFNVIWQVGVRGAGIGTWNLKALAVDNLGATTETAPVEVYYYTGGPPAPILEVLSPRNGDLFAAPATFLFSAEVLASLGDNGPVEFFVGTNSVGLVNQGGLLSATAPPSSVTVRNLLEGEYKLTVRYRGVNGIYCTCNRITNTIRVVKLGVQLPSLTPDGRLQFEVVTSFPGKENVIEASPNLRDWLPISTNQPSSNTFTFTEPSPATNSQRFYRVFVGP